MLKTEKVTRVEVINHQGEITDKDFGRVFAKKDCNNVELQLQDEDKTLKIFIR